MSDELQLISDGDGLAVLGEPAAIEQFLRSENLTSTDLPLAKLGSVLSTGSAATHVGSELAATSGRWVKLTDQSAQMVSKYGLRESSTSGLSTGVIKGSKGQIRGFVEFSRHPGTLLTNPAVLAGAAGIMAQLAMQQTMDEITDYLAKIDKKVDDILRAQTDAVIADMIGVELIVDEAMTVRTTVGRVSEVTWSKVQGTAATIARTQAYALRRLDALASQLNDSDVGALATVANEARSTVHDWLAVIARCFQLHDALAVLELDRVLETTPLELDDHRLALTTARRRRVELIEQATRSLLSSMDAASDLANAKVLVHPTKSPVVVTASNVVAESVEAFHRPLGIASQWDAAQARRWRSAAGEKRDQFLESGIEGAQAVKSLGADVLSRVRSARLPRFRSTKQQNEDEAAD